jgi:hypothetical protein
MNTRNCASDPGQSASGPEPRERPRSGSSRTGENVGDDIEGRGQFGGIGLASGRRFDAAELVDLEPRLGLPREAVYIWGTARNRDGDLFVYARRMAAPDATAGAGASEGGLQHSMNDRFLLQASFDAEYPRLRREARSTAVGDDVRRSVEEGRAVLRIPAAGDRQAMELVAGDDVMSYTEGDVLDLSGVRLAPALHWYLPMGSDALYYPTQTWSVAGRILGHDVEGFAFVEEAYMPPGGRLYVAHDPLPTVGYRLWYSWATTWDDGTTEFGHFVGNGSTFSVGIIADADGRVRTTRDLGIAVERAEDGYWYDRIRLDVDGEAWEIVADPRGRMQDLGPIPNPQQEALVRRVGETRTPRIWMAWGETVPATDS